MKNNFYNKNDIDIIAEAYNNSLTINEARHITINDPIVTEMVDALLKVLNEHGIEGDKKYPYIVAAKKLINNKTDEFFAEREDSADSEDSEDIDDEVEYTAEENMEEDAEDIYNIEAEFRPGKKYGEKSYLDVKIEDIYGAKSFEEAADLFRKFTEAAKIYPKNKAQILDNIKQIEEQGADINRLWKYATNCMFKMKKMGLK